MRVEDWPEFSDDEAGEVAENEMYEKVKFVDYKVWRTLENVDSLLKPYGLEVVCFEGNDDVFTIEAIKND
jgi:hypothetical protein